MNFKVIFKVLISKYFIKMFRIKPIRNQTTAKYTYHNQNNIIQSKINVPAKLTSLNHQPINQIFNP